VLISIF